MDALACEGGCSNTLKKVKAPWIYVPDFEGWHGRAVDTLVRASTDFKVQTVLDELGVDQLKDCPGTTDVDLIVSFAKVAEAVDFDGVPSPLAVNMSLGRAQRMEDAVDALCKEDACQSGSGLSCQVARLLEHLTWPPAANLPRPRAVAVAAAGNHKVLHLFPASLDGVVAAGGMDHTLFADGDAVSSWETPVDDVTSFPQALMPATPHCLDLLFEPPSGPPVRREAIVPSGTSFSAALFTGIVTDVIERNGETVMMPLLRPGTSGWEPRLDCNGSFCEYRLAQGTKVFQGLSGRGGDVLKAVFENDPGNCDPVPNPVESATLKEVDESHYPTRLQSLAAVLNGTRPAPEPDQCAPCAGCCGRDLRTNLTNLTPPTKAERPGKTTTGYVDVSLEIDLHAQWAVPPEYVLEDLYLRFGDRFWKLEQLSVGIEEFAQGNVAYLKIAGRLYKPDFDTQPSMVSVLSFAADTDPPGSYWHPTPLVLRE